MPKQLRKDVEFLQGDGGVRGYHIRTAASRGRAVRRCKEYLLGLLPEPQPRRPRRRRSSRPSRPAERRIRRPGRSRTPSRPGGSRRNTRRRRRPSWRSSTSTSGRGTPFHREAKEGGCRRGGEGGLGGYANFASTRGLRAHLRRRVLAAKTRKGE